MIFISFPIAYLPNPVNPSKYVILPTYLIPEDDTSDVIPRQTYLRHATYPSATRNFRLNPKEVSGLKSLDPPTFICITPKLCSASRAGETRDRAERGSKAAKRVSTPRCSLRSRRIPTHVFHVEHRRMIIPADQHTHRGFDTRLG